jgi:RNA polymerase sigma factor (sigma-70 family)
VGVRRRTQRDPDFEEAFDDLFSKAMRVAYRILGNAAAAEDVAAEALARTCASWARVRELPYLEAWVLRVAGNLAIDETRRRTPDIELRAAPDPQDAAIMRLVLGVALRKLSRRQRDVVVLRYLMGLSEQETAEALGISLGTLRTHSTRALDALRRRLGRDFHEGVSFAAPT